MEFSRGDASRTLSWPKHPKTGRPGSGPGLDQGLGPGLAQGQAQGLAQGQAQGLAQGPGPGHGPGSWSGPGRPAKSSQLSKGLQKTATASNGCAQFLLHPRGWFLTLGGSVTAEVLDLSYEPWPIMAAMAMAAHGQP